MTETETSSTRLWKGKDGKFEVEAVYVALFQKTKVKLRKAGGGMIAVPLDRLSEEDLAYVAARSGQSAIVVQTEEAKVDHQNDVDPATNSYFAFRPRMQPICNIPEHQIHTPDTAPPATISAPSYAERVPSVGYASPVPPNGNNSHDDHVVPMPTPVEYKKPETVRAIRPNSIQLLPQRSLSSITQKFLAAQSHWHPRPRNLAGFPPNILTTIGRHLDTLSRIRFAQVSRAFRHSVLHPDAWYRIWFHRNDLHRVDTQLVHDMTRSLLSYQLHHAVFVVEFDGSLITADAVVHTLLNFPNLRRLSIKSCFECCSSPLSGKLMHVAALGSYTRLRLERFEMGKMLRRGIDQKESEKKANAPQSLGQDVYVISTALERLASRPVSMDCHLCDYCQVDAAASTLNCAGCGIVDIHKCLACAPKCDRCSVRLCGRPECREKTIQLSALKCNQCHKPLYICNQLQSQNCVVAKRPCAGCKGVYHTQCRTKDDVLVPNQCTRCGIVACPLCDLTGCGAGCQGQWCRACVDEAGLGHCRCFSLERATGGKIRKRIVCKHCRLSCNKCGSNSFCARCLKLHSNQCA